MARAQTGSSSVQRRAGTRCTVDPQARDLWGCSQFVYGSLFIYNYPWAKRCPGHPTLGANLVQRVPAIPNWVSSFLRGSIKRIYQTDYPVIICGHLSGCPQLPRTGGGHRLVVVPDAVPATSLYVSYYVTRYVVLYHIYYCMSSL